MKVLSIRFWMNNRNSTGPVRHGYTRPTDWDVAMLRIGPLVIGWEVEED